MQANPFDVLGIPRTTVDEQVVKDAYRKWAAIYHPDRGGDPRRFQVVTQAQAQILELLKLSKSESFDHLKMKAGQQLQPVDQSAATLGSGQNFDHGTFNRVFDTHQMWDPNQDGYGERMTSTVDPNMSPEEMIQARDRDLNVRIQDDTVGLRSQFSGDQFNMAFQKSAVQMQEHDRSTSLVKRHEPDVMQVYANPLSMASNLSYEKVTDFSSPFSGGAGGGFTDYMKAFSADSLITPHVETAESYGPQTVQELEQMRGNMSFIPEPELVQARAELEATEKEQDDLRYRNFLHHQELGEETTKKINNLLADRSFAHL